MSFQETGSPPNVAATGIPPGVEAAVKQYELVKSVEKRE